MMANFLIEGENRIGGELPIHGAKNAALPILAAALLTRRSVLHNCPDLSDVRAAAHILEHLGCTVEREGDTVIVESDDGVYCDIPDGLMREMRDVYKRQPLR